MKEVFGDIWKYKTFRLALITQAIWQQLYINYIYIHICYALICIKDAQVCLVAFSRKSRMPESFFFCDLRPRTLTKSSRAVCGPGPRETSPGDIWSSIFDHLGIPHEGDDLFFSSYY